MSLRKIDTVSFFPVMLAGYESSQHCSYALMYALHTRELTCTHMLTHKHARYTPVLLGLLDVRSFFNCLLLEKDQEVLRLLLRGKLLLGKEMSQRWQKHAL